MTDLHFAAMSRATPRATAGGRPLRRCVLLAALALLHACLLWTLVRSRVQVPATTADVVNMAIFSAPPPAARALTRPLPPQWTAPPAARAVPRRRAPPPTAGPQPLHEPALSLAAPQPASAASMPLPPLNLALTPAQLQAIVRAGNARSPVAGDRAWSGMVALGDDTDKLRLKSLPHGETEVHVHGGCYRLVPSLASRFDPFNHANEMLIAPC